MCAKATYVGGGNGRAITVCESETPCFCCLNYRYLPKEYHLFECASVDATVHTDSTHGRATVGDVRKPGNVQRASLWVCPSPGKVLLFSYIHDLKSSSRARYWRDQLKWQSWEDLCSHLWSSFVFLDDRAQNNPSRRVYPSHYQGT